MFTHWDQNSVTKNLKKREKKISGQWRQGRRVHAHMSPQGWVPIERGGRNKICKIKIDKKICNLILCCSGVHLDHNNMEPPQRTGGTNINISCIDKLLNFMMVHIKILSVEKLSNVGLFFSDFLPNVWETWRCLVRLALPSRHTGGGR